MAFLQRLGEQRGTWSGPFSLNPQSGKYKDPALNRLFGVDPVYAGVPVDESNAFYFSAVFDAVNQIASDIGKLPKNLRKRRKEGGSDPYVDSKLYWLLKYRPNPEMTAMVFWRTITAHALTCKGGFAEIVRDQLGRPAELWIITPDRVQAHRRKLADGSLGPLMWKIDGDERNLIPDADMFHISGLGYDGINGYGVIAMARQTIGLALAAEKFGAQYFGRGTMFGGHLESEAEDETQKGQLLEAIEKFRASQDAAFRILITGPGNKFTQFTNKPADSQMDQTRVSQVLEVARFFRMPPVRLGVTTPGAVSYASAEVSNQDYYTGALLDWITLAEGECWAKLIPASEKAIQYVKFNANVFLRGDSKARAEFYGAMLDKGVFCADDVLDLEDMNPQPNGQGRMYLVQGAQVPKHLLEASVQAKIDKDKAPPPAALPPAGTDPADDDTRARLERAETALEAARTELETQREARVAAEASGVATAAELAERRSAESHAIALAAQLTGTVDALRAEVRAAEARVLEVESTAAARAEELLAQVRTATEAAEVAEARVASARSELTDAADRHRVAEAAVEGLRAQLTEATAAVTAVTGDADAQRAEVERVRGELTEAVRLADQLAGEAASHVDALTTARAEAEVLRASVTSLETQLSDANSAREAAETAREACEASARDAVAASERVESQRLAAEASRAEADSTVEALRAQLAEAITAVAARGDDVAAREAEVVRLQGELERALSDVESARQSAESIRAEAATSVDEIRRQLADATSAVDARVADVLAREADVQRLSSELAEAIARADALTADSARASSEAGATITSLETDLEAARTKLTRTEADLEAMRQAAASSTCATCHGVALLPERDMSDPQGQQPCPDCPAGASMAAALTQQEADRQRVTDLESRLATAQQDAYRSEEQLREWRVRTVAAHRSLFIDALGRMARRGAAQARTKQATSAKLRRWLDDLAAVEIPLCAEALTPAMRTHLAWLGSDEDPVVAATAMAREHVELFVSKLRAIADAEPEDFHADLEAALTRWETDRPAAVADAIVAKEVRHVA